MEDESRGVVPGQRCSEVGGNAADEQASGLFVQGHRPTQDSGEQGTEGSQGSEAASVLEEKSRGEVHVASLHVGARLARAEVALHIVVVDPPAQAIAPGADFSQRLQEFEQADIIVAFALHDGERVVGGYRVNG